MSKIYFASDFHLGVPGFEASLAREKKILRWLNEISKDAEALYLVGDIFDFWFEYRYTVPKHFVRLLGKLAEMSDQGIRIEYFTGNHDMWAFDYLSKELGVTMHRKPVLHALQGKKLFIGHGDGLGPGDTGYKIIKKVFSNPVCQWLFARIHPNLGFAIANYWSGKSRISNPPVEKFLGEDREWLMQYSKMKFRENPEIDYFIFGHRHLPLNKTIEGNCRYINLGDWFYWYSYAVLENGKLELKQFEPEHPIESSQLD